MHTTDGLFEVPLFSLCHNVQFWPFRWWVPCFFHYYFVEQSVMKCWRYGGFCGFRFKNLRIRITQSQKKKKEVGAENSDLFGEKSHRDPDFLHSLGSTFFKSNPNNENSNYYNIYYFSCLSGFTQYVRYHNLCFSSICSSGRRSFDTIKCDVAGFCLYALAWSSQFRKKMLYNVREK